ncbi:MAG: hypothetical protein LBG58_13665 [Planctomycetaceae bacterium]|jgi:hypothetical protein|nr:hypothetical protein [Planctomycetaceae bacterium]
MYGYLTLILQLLLILTLVIGLVKIIVKVFLQNIRDNLFLEMIELKQSVTEQQNQGLIDNDLANTHLQDIDESMIIITDNNMKTIIKNMSQNMDNHELINSKIEIFRICIMWKYLATKSWSALFIVGFSFLLIYKSHKKKNTIINKNFYWNKFAMLMKPYCNTQTLSAICQ